MDDFSFPRTLRFISTSCCFLELDVSASQRFTVLALNALPAESLLHGHAITISVGVSLNEPEDSSAFTKLRRPRNSRN
ncbi:hypothetical protein CesoFtcFv8_025018 [Champsocephalus esox]|uniref:Uncharacterized protein n=1 Tax=Champsocephalus esox TaxID=159716 RepID=A0AAN8B2Z7_9TELE|nr:hypothetical protein CesoFtcFv8_025018 [Champsocephalus esox]